LTARENIYLNGAIVGMKKIEIDRKPEIVSFADVERLIQTPVPCADVDGRTPQ
jgi:lipopolysaccharide transport system ATP-binding protein